jgi:hypothetical protein
VGLVGGPEAELLRLVFLASLMGHAVFVGLELFGPHPTAHARLAAERITRGPYGGLFWLGGVGIGLLLAGLLALLPSVPAWAGAALAVLVGLLAYNWGFVMAPQEIPNS